MAAAAPDKDVISDNIGRKASLFFYIFSYNFIKGALAKDADVSGYLFKRRGGFGKHMPNCWQQRFFTMKDGVLCYYDCDEDIKPRGKLDLRSTTYTIHVGTHLGNGIILSQNLF